MGNSAIMRLILVGTIGALSLTASPPASAEAAVAPARQQSLASDSEICGAYKQNGRTWYFRNCGSKGVEVYVAGPVRWPPVIPTSRCVSAGADEYIGKTWEATAVWSSGNTCN